MIEDRYFDYEKEEEAFKERARNGLRDLLGDYLFDCEDYGLENDQALELFALECKRLAEEELGVFFDEKIPDWMRLQNRRIKEEQGK